MSERYVPLSEVQTQHIRVVGELPFGLSEHIGLNTKHVQRLMQLGGTRHLRIEMDHDGERTKVHGVPLSVNPDWSSTLGQIRTSQVEPYEHHSARNNQYDGSKQSTWINVNTMVNIPETTQRILDNGGNVKDEKLWASHINEAITSSLRSEGTKHLLSVPNPFIRPRDLYFYVFQAFNGYIFVDNALQHNVEYALTKLLSVLIAQGTLITIFDTPLAGREHRGVGRRFSLFLGLEIDRMIALQIASYTRPVAMILPK